MAGKDIHGDPGEAAFQLDFLCKAIAARAVYAGFEGIGPWTLQ